jgi:hypothetical protein
MWPVIGRKKWRIFRGQGLTAKSRRCFLLAFSLNFLRGKTTGDKRCGKLFSSLFDGTMTFTFLITSKRNFLRLLYWSILFGVCCEIWHSAMKFHKE